VKLSVSGGVHCVNTVLRVVSRVAYGTNRALCEVDGATREGSLRRASCTSHWVMSAQRAAPCAVNSFVEHCLYQARPDGIAVGMLDGERGAYCGIVLPSLNTCIIAWVIFLSCMCRPRVPRGP
jgi:hypothetical protein